MKTVIKYPIVSILSLKKLAKTYKRIEGSKTLSDAQEALAKHLGFKDWHHICKSLDNGFIIVQNKDDVSIPETLNLGVFVATSELRGSSPRISKESNVGRGVINWMKNFESMRDSLGMGGDKYATSVEYDPEFIKYFSQLQGRSNENIKNDFDVQKDSVKLTFADGVLKKPITFFGQRCNLACDAKCEKAWGMNKRPRDANEDMLRDDLLGSAPTYPGTYEGSCGKPTSVDELLNKWCARECERSTIFKDDEEMKLPKFI